VASNFLRDLVISVLHRLRQSRTLHTLTFGPISGVHFNRPSPAHGAFLTRKNFRADTLLGQQLWVFEGSGRPKTYRLVRYGTIRSVSRDPSGEANVRFKIDGPKLPVTVPIRDRAHVDEASAAIATKISEARGRSSKFGLGELPQWFVGAADDGVTRQLSLIYTFSPELFWAAL
jgi:hypothetical protein